MIIRDENYSNVVYFPSTQSDGGHSGELIIEDYDNWRNPELIGAVQWCLSFRDDQTEAA